MESNCYKDSTPFIPTRLFRESFFGYFEGATQKESYATFAKAAELSPEEVFGSLTLPEEHVNGKTVEFSDYGKVKGNETTAAVIK